MEKLNSDNIKGVSGGFGSQNFGFGEEETRQEIQDFMLGFNNDPQATLNYFKMQAEQFANVFSVPELQTDKNLEKAQYYSHLYNTMANDPSYFK